VLFQFWATDQEFFESGHMHSVSCAIRLRDNPDWTGLEPKNYGQTDEALFANQRNLHAPPIRLNCEHGSHTVVHKIGRPNDFGCIVHYMMEIQSHEFQFG